jgi:type II secretory pathway pseudopilin PulG
MNTRRYNAFTFLELLVVVALIALLMALLVPALDHALRAAQVVFCGSNQHAIGVGLSAWLADHRSQYPAVHNFGALLGNRGTSVHYGSDMYDERQRPLNPYLGYQQGPVRAAQCPADLGDILSFDLLVNTNGPATYTPTENTYQGYGSSYQEAFKTSRWKVKAVFGQIGETASPSITRFQISRTDNKILLGDWPYFGDRRLGSDRTRWHTAKEERRLNILFADMHSEFFLFPHGEMENPWNADQSPNPSFYWW